jgi:clan AA aspartic protease (TIGR02281 family)
MLNRYRFNIENTSQNQGLNFDDRYKGIVNKILEANQNLDIASQKYYGDIQKYPRPSLDYSILNSIIKLKKNILGMLLINVKVKNKKMKFLIDTGAEVTILTDEALSSVGISYDVNDKINVGSSNNQKSEINLALLDRIEIGGVNFLNLPVLVISEKKVSFSVFNIKLFKLDGILGWDVLKQLDFEIDYNKSKLRIIEFNTWESESESNLIKSSFPTILVSDENENIKIFGLDTGSRKSWLNDNLVGTIGIKVVKQKKHKIIGAHGKDEETVNIIKEYKIKLSDKQLIFNNISTGFTGFLNNFEFDGVLGTEVFKNNIIKIINSKGIILIK